MKVRITQRFKDGTRPARHLQGQLETVTGYLVRDDVKPLDFGRIIKRMRVIDDRWNLLCPELLDAREPVIDGDHRRAVGFNAYKQYSVSDVRWVLQEWDMVVLEVMAEPPAAPKMGQQKYVDLSYFDFVHKGEELRTPRRITQAMADKRIPGARRLDETRKRVRVDDEYLAYAKAHGMKRLDDFDPV
jgi:hypothetical protein